MGIVISNGLETQLICHTFNQLYYAEKLSSIKNHVYIPIRIYVIQHNTFPFSLYLFSSFSYLYNPASGF